MKNISISWFVWLVSVCMLVGVLAGCAQVRGHGSLSTTSVNTKKENGDGENRPSYNDVEKYPDFTLITITVDDGNKKDVAKSMTFSSVTDGKGNTLDYMQLDGDNYKLLSPGHVQGEVANVGRIYYVFKIRDNHAKNINKLLGIDRDILVRINSDNSTFDLLIDGSVDSIRITGGTGIPKDGFSELTKQFLFGGYIRVSLEKLTLSSTPPQEYFNQSNILARKVTAEKIAL
jgi:hypothetical protein